MFWLCQEIHPGIHAEFIAEKSATTKRPVKRLRDTSTTGECSTAKKQCSLVSSMKKQAVPVSQKEFEHTILLMLLEDMQPLATVERSGFQKLFQKILPNVQMPSRRTLGRQIDDLHQLHKADLIAELTNVTYLSVAADLWSSHKRGFLGLTVHYIDPERLERVSHVLACRCFKGSHTGQQIAAVMTGIFEEFEITCKVTACITDNAANMAKAVRLLEATASSESIDTDSVDAAVSTDDASVEAVPIHDLLAEEASRDDDLKMMAKQVRCANHTLNLVAAVDKHSSTK